jgi:hypothetical protein
LPLKIDINFFCWQKVTKSVVKVPESVAEVPELAAKVPE